LETQNQDGLVQIETEKSLKPEECDMQTKQKVHEHAQTSMLQQIDIGIERGEGKMSFAQTVGSWVLDVWSCSLELLSLRHHHHRDRKNNAQSGRDSSTRDPKIRPSLAAMRGGATTKTYCNARSPWNSNS